ncbi:hypothetical protein EN873_22235 [bacterium M00.F.Ca.ET.230.01.1.1]|nr:hypothetical protein EN873_22235 [bacterium M00.F.Ca.ET.230.01.1.1]
MSWLVLFGRPHRMVNYVPDQLRIWRAENLSSDLGQLAPNLDLLDAQLQHTLTEQGKFAQSIETQKSLMSTLRDRETMRSTAQAAEADTKSNAIDATETSKLAVQKGHLDNAEARAVTERKIDKTVGESATDNTQKLSGNKAWVQLGLMNCLKVLFVGAVTGVICLPLASVAAPRDVRIEEGECWLMTAANEALAKMPAFQTTWDQSVTTLRRRMLKHTDSVYDNGLEYWRTAPYQRWSVKPYALHNVEHSDCHQMREETVDGVRTAVISYTRYNPRGSDARRYKCTAWIEIPNYRNRKMFCDSDNFADDIKIKIHWFYWPDIEPPTVNPKKP